MDTLGENLLRVESRLGNIEGQIAGLLRELTRFVGQLDQHLQDDRIIHAAHDDRLMRTVREISGEISSVAGRLTERVEQIEKRLESQAGARGMAEKWRLGLLSALSTASGYIGGWLSRWPAGHH
jgi:hypothetical protein